MITHDTGQLCSDHTRCRTVTYRLARQDDRWRWDPGREQGDEVVDGGREAGEVVTEEGRCVCVGGGAVDDGSMSAV